MPVSKYLLLLTSFTKGDRVLIQHPPEAGGKFFPAYIEQTARAADTRKDGKGRSLAKVEASWADSRSGDHIRVRPGAFCYPLFVPAFSFKCSVGSCNCS